MSLLNQVLRDLDDRAPADAPRPVNLAEAPRTGPQPVEAREPVAPDWVRLGTWSALAVALALWAWVYFGLDAPAPRSERLMLPRAQLATPNARPAVSLPTSPRTPTSGLTPTSVEPAPVPVVAPHAEAAPSGPKDAPVMPADSAPTPQRRAPVPLSDPPAPPPGGYLPLRNAGPLDAAAPETGEASTRQVKTVKDVAPGSLARVREALGDGELAEAESLLRQRLQRMPGDRIARELLVGLMMRGDRIAEAMHQIDLGLEQHPGHVSFTLIKSRLLAQAGRADEAVRLLAALRARHPRHARLLQMLGALYQQQAQYARAVETYRALLTLTPSSAPAWAGLAIGLDGAGDAVAVEMVVDAYRRALAIGGLPVAAATYARQRLAQLDPSDG